MKKIKAFIYVFTKSLTSPNYYNDVIKTGFAFSIKYYLSLIAILSLLIATGVTIRLVPQVNSTVSDIATQAKTIYPDDLIFTMQDGTWDVNRPQPFIVPMPDSIKSSSDASAPVNAIVFDKSGTINDLDKYQTAILVNSVNMISKDSSNGAIKAYPLKDIPNGQFDKSQFTTMVDSIVGLEKYVPLIIFGAVLLGMLAYFVIVRMIYLLIAALVVYFIASLMNSKLSYANSYKLALNNMTLPLVLSAILTISGLNIPVPMWFFLINIGSAFLAIQAIKKETAVEAAEPKPITPKPEEVATVTEDKDKQQQ